MERKAKIERKTKETEVWLELNLDGSGKHGVKTSIPFLDHMLSLFSAHGLFDLKLKARGDRKVDDHHTAEDIGICLGNALQKALGGKEGIARYGSAFVPMDESLASVHVDLSGRPGLVFDLPFRRRKIGDFDTELVQEFFQALANNAAVTLHAKVVYGKNGHHMVESLFKALGRALRQAVSRDEKIKGIPSTKGKL
ncbi:MAG: imidazoleglycerol-phosphate dehydratase [Deltaproteobacteria bacterium SM23_61]|nr:MAG: imidazoleglycerol-phosphate dehydratase [Deltaproteobacteria bacterium SM23_61]